MKYVLAVSKACNSQENRRNNYYPRRYWRMYYIDAYGHVHVQKVSVLEALYYKSGLHKRRVFVCLKCGSKFMGLGRKDTNILACPYCSK